MAVTEFFDIGDDRITDVFNSLGRTFDIQVTVVTQRNFMTDTVSISWLCWSARGTSNILPLQNRVKFFITSILDVFANQNKFVVGLHVPVNPHAWMISRPPALDEVMKSVRRDGWAIGEGGQPEPRLRFTLVVGDRLA